MEVKNWDNARNYNFDVDGDVDDDVDDDEEDD